ncbi:hypothetical protein NKH48_17545 [Mesorhizobium sp. M1233]|uniref:hypothetical protein n=1 Tax=unclassified Mesorhizobium TaxID=325217 RepID=UPI0033367CEC
MIRIDELNIVLPRSLRSRTDSILHHVGEALRRERIDTPLHVGELRAVDARVSSARSDAAIGNHIATAIMDATKRVGGSGGG